MKIKRIISIIMSAVLLICGTSIIANAEASIGDEEITTVGDITFIFEANTPEFIKEKFIADLTNEDDNSASPCGLTCTLFGHKLTTTIATTITHKAKSTAPRCLKAYYDYEVCSRCDYANRTKTAQTYIYCCS